MTPLETEMSAQEAFLVALLDTDRQAARRVLESACQVDGPTEALETLVRPVLERIGNRWETGELALSQVYMSGRICEELIETLQPEQSGHGAGSEPRVAIGVIEDHHALGKRMVLSVAISDFRGRAARLMSSFVQNGYDTLR